MHKSDPGLRVGDQFSLELADPSRWRRFVHWVLRRPAPTKLSTFTVCHVISGGDGWTRHEARPFYDDADVEWD